MIFDINILKYLKTLKNKFKIKNKKITFFKIILKLKKQVKNATSRETLWSMIAGIQIPNTACVISYRGCSCPYSLVLSSGPRPRLL